VTESAFGAPSALLFLSRTQAATIDALVEQIVPGEEGSPGAREAGVTEYIDRALAGFMRDLQPLYRKGLIALADSVISRFGVPFVELGEDQQRLVVAELDELGRSNPGDFIGQFYRIVREHTVQGFFGDPAYGGNRDVVGWKLVGFPGAQWSYSAEQMRPGTDSRTIPIVTVADLFSRIGGRR
jgi:gluconate 2-dehydrogenase gamma chain